MRSRQWLLVASGITLGFFLGGSLSTNDDVRSTPEMTEELVAAAPQTAEGWRVTPAHCPPTECDNTSSVSDGGTETLVLGDDALASMMVEHLWQQTHLVDIRPDGASMPVEMKANELDSYLRGWGDALQVGGPTHVRHIGRAIGVALCGSDVDDTDRVVLSRVVLRFGSMMPEARQGLQCVLSSHSDEDVVLWSALDAWRRADYGTDSAWDEWRQRATDPRTIRRLQPWADRENDQDRSGPMADLARNRQQQQNL